MLFQFPSASNDHNNHFVHLQVCYGPLFEVLVGKARSAKLSSSCNRFSLAFSSLSSPPHRAPSPPSPPIDRARMRAFNFSCSAAGNACLSSSWVERVCELLMTCHDSHAHADTYTQNKHTHIHTHAHTQTWKQICTLQIL